MQEVQIYQRFTGNRTYLGNSNCLVAVTSHVYTCCPQSLLVSQFNGLWLVEPPAALLKGTSCRDAFLMTLLHLVPTAATHQNNCSIVNVLQLTYRQR